MYEPGDVPQLCLSLLQESVCASHVSVGNSLSSYAGDYNGVSSFPSFIVLLWNVDDSPSAFVVVFAEFEASTCGEAK